MKVLSKLFCSTILLSSSVLFNSCGSDDAVTGSFGIPVAATSMTSASAILKSIDSSSSFAFAGFAAAESIDKAGVAGTHCNATGEPKNGSGNIASTSDSFAGGHGFCQVSHNAQSPDTARGAMYIGAGVLCAVGNAGAFTGVSVGNPVTKTNVTIDIDTTCWGTSAEVSAFQADMGNITSFTLASATVTELSTGPYNYKIELEDSNLDMHMVLYVLSGSSNNLSFHATEYTSSAKTQAKSSYAFNADLQNGVVYYEQIDNDNGRRIRIRVAGSVNTSGFTSVDDVQGYLMNSSGSTGSFTHSYHVTYRGDLSTGLLGNYYATGTTRENKCYLPTDGSAACSGTTAIGSTIAEGASMATDLNNKTALNALAAYTGTLINFSSVDPTDLDITQ